MMIMKVEGDPADLERYAGGAGGEVLRRIAEAGKAAGALRHCFGGGDGEVLIVDEWPDESTFRRFFDNHPDIPAVMRDAGARGAPQISFYRVLDTPDRF